MKVKAWLQNSYVEHVDRVLCLAFDRVELCLAFDRVELCLAFDRVELCLASVFKKLKIPPDKVSGNIRIYNMKPKNDTN